MKERKNECTNPAECEYSITFRKNILLGYNGGKPRVGFIKKTHRSSGSNNHTGYWLIFSFDLFDSFIFYHWALSMNEQGGRLKTLRKARFFQCRLVSTSSVRAS
jgi:hypothetical protein